MKHKQDTKTSPWSITSVTLSKFTQYKSAALVSLLMFAGFRHYGQHFIKRNYQLSLVQQPTTSCLVQSESWSYKAQVWDNAVRGTGLWHSHVHPALGVSFGWVSRHLLSSYCIASWFYKDSYISDGFIIGLVIFQLTHGYTVKTIIKYHSCLEWLRKPLLTCLTMFQRDPSDHLGKQFVLLSSSSHVQLNRYWLVAYTRLQKGTRAAGR